MDAPELFGMDHNADTAFLVNQGRALIADLLAAQPRLTAAVGYAIHFKGAEEIRKKSSKQSSWIVSSRSLSVIEGMR